MGSRREDEFFQEFAPHTRFKHLLLEHYLESWVHKVGQAKRAEDHLVMIDAFAGEGADEAGNSGSPIRMARVAAQIEGRLALMRNSSVSLDVLLMEHDKERRQRLQTRVAPFGDRVRVLEGTLDQQIEWILAAYPTAPMLFFLDPFGISGLNAEVLRRALSVPTREILLLVDDDGAQRLVRVATNPVSRGAKRLREKARELDLFLDNEAQREKLLAEAARSQAHLERTGSKAAVHLTRAVGGDDRWRRLAAISDPLRLREEIVNLFEGLLWDAGAAYTTRVPVHSESGQQKYVLLHASQNRHGRSTMKCEVQRALGQCDLLPRVIAGMKAGMSGDMETAVMQIRDVYAGREALWREGAEGSLRDYALQETGLFPWQLLELETRLKLAGCRLPGQTHHYRFPASSLSPR